MNGTQSSPIFALFDTTGAETMPALMDLWTTHCFPSDAAISFSLNAEVARDVPLWRANFPADLEAAISHLNRSEAVLLESQTALATAIDRASLMVHDLLFESDGSGSSFAFDVSSTRTALAQPEQELLLALREIQAPDRSLSYGIGDTIVGYSQPALAQLQATMDRLLHVVAYYAWIETQIEGCTLARTAVGWFGNVDTIWQTGLSTTQVSLHQRTVSLSLASRNALVQTLSTAVQLALKLSALSTVPGGVILLLPAVWKFIDRIVTQSRAGLTHEHV
jgi:hypothetical protein